MLRARFSLDFAWRVIIYLRMSSDLQNPRSPLQQLEVIRELIRRMGLPWIVVAEYRDDAISGRTRKNRPGFVKMMRDIKLGAVKADLILVDTFERLSRGDDCGALRNELKRLGLLVLTADSGFADPTTLAGKALGFVEVIRAVCDGEVKAHNVVRGKADAVRQGKWPGGPVPFGYRLRPVMMMVEGAEKFLHNDLEPDPACQLVVKEMFRLADELGFGDSRIAKRLNADSTIAEALKPIHSTSIGDILSNRIYYGELVWGKNCTGLVDEERVIEPQDAEDWVRKPGFCEPLVSRELWDRVQAIRLSRGRPRTDAMQLPTMPGTSRPGMALKYPLSGLVRCATCGRSMTATSGSPYTLKSGERKRYVYYQCPGVLSDACKNRRHISEPWLREHVIGVVRKRLHLDDCQEENPAFVEFLVRIRQEFATLDVARPDVSQTLSAERTALDEKRQGWIQSLGRKSLPEEVRLQIEAQFAAAATRMREIDAELSMLAARDNRQANAVDPPVIAARLQQLASMLDGQNATAANLHLAQHIDYISCDAEGKCVMRICRVGALARDLDLVPRENVTLLSAEATDEIIKRRRRRLAAGAISNDDEADAAANDFATDPNRFAGLGPDWFWEDRFCVPDQLSWAQVNARQVAEYRLATAATMKMTAKVFGKSIPTILAALYHAVALGMVALGKAISKSRRPSWALTHAREVAEFLARDGSTLRAAAMHFNKSEPTIRKAAAIAEELRLPPDSQDAA